MPMFSVVLTTTLLTILSSTHVSGMTLEERIRDDSDLSQVRPTFSSSPERPCTTFMSVVVYNECHDEYKKDYFPVFMR